jgi:hypothetical protein
MRCWPHGGWEFVLVCCGKLWSAAEPRWGDVPCPDPLLCKQQRFVCHLVCGHLVLAVTWLEGALQQEGGVACLTAHLWLRAQRG